MSYVPLYICFTFILPDLCWFYFPPSSSLLYNLPHWVRFSCRWEGSCFHPIFLFGGLFSIPNSYYRLGPHFYPLFPSQFRNPRPLVRVWGCAILGPSSRLGPMFALHVLRWPMFLTNIRSLCTHRLITFSVSVQCINAGPSQF